MNWHTTSTAEKFSVEPILAVAKKSKLVTHSQSRICQRHCSVINSSLRKRVAAWAESAARAIMELFIRGNKRQLMATSLLREVTEPAIFVPDVAKQHDVFVRAIAFGVLVSARTGFWLDEIIRNLFERFNEDLPKPALIPPTVFGRKEWNADILGPGYHSFSKWALAILTFVLF